jgi:citrate synthase
MAVLYGFAEEVLGEMGIKDDALLDGALELEQIALHDDYFIEKRLYSKSTFISASPLRRWGSDLDVHGAFRGRPHGRLDRAVEGNK